MDAASQAGLTGNRGTLSAEDFSAQRRISLGADRRDRPNSLASRHWLIEHARTTPDNHVSRSPQELTGRSVLLEESCSRLGWGAGFAVRGACRRTDRTGRLSRAVSRRACYGFATVSTPECARVCPRLPVLTTSPMGSQPHGALEIPLARNAFNGLVARILFVDGDPFRDRPIQPLSHLSAGVFTRT